MFSIQKKSQTRFVFHIRLKIFAAATFLCGWENVDLENKNAIWESID